MSAASSWYGYRVSGTGSASTLPMDDSEKAKAAELEESRVLGFTAGELEELEETPAPNSWNVAYDYGLSLGMDEDEASLYATLRASCGVQDIAARFLVNDHSRRAGVRRAIRYGIGRCSGDELGFPCYLKDGHRGAHASTPEGARSREGL